MTSSLCYPERIIQHFRIDDSAEITACDKHNEQLPNLNVGDVFAPTSPLKPISAYACTLKEVTFEYTFYVFGAKPQRDSPPVSAQSVSKDI